MKEYMVLHLFSGLGGAALGFQSALVEYRGMVGRFRSLVGIDVDPEACADFRALTGSPAVEMDLFTAAQYTAFHGFPPPDNWREVSPADLLAATGGEHPDVVFASPPCKGFSGLLPHARAATDRYQALNSLVLRGIQLTLDAFADDLPAVIMIENVPRITSRGAGLLAQVKRLLTTHGYVFHEGYHDCGEIGALAQHRRRYLLIARLQSKVAGFVYRPPKYRVRAIGEVLGSLPLPDDPSMGPMHRLPRLQWRTWVRLALIPAGGDWRDLETANLDSLRLMYVPRPGAYGVAEWDYPTGTVVGSGQVRGSNGVAAVADPRLPDRDSGQPGVYRVVRRDDAAPCVTGTRSGSGAPTVDDLRLSPGLGRNFAGSPGLYGLLDWREPARSITGSARVTSSNCPAAVTDPRGATAAAGPRLGCTCRSGSYGVQAWDQPARTVIGAGDIHAGATAVADPRIPDDRESGTWVILALDGTWHRPLTTLELAALQGFDVAMPDGRPLLLAGASHSRWRERIGNAVPPAAAKGIAEAILPALMNSDGRLELSNEGIWVLPTLWERRERECDAV